MQRTNWLERKFNFDFPAGLLPNIIARLSGTTARLNHIAFPLSDIILSSKPDGKWSIKEHIGHLSKTESLHTGRIEDILERKETLRPAGMKRLPEEPDYNQLDIQDLLLRFEVKRRIFISRIESLDDEIQNRLSFHPRLQVMMRPIDIAFFAAEHDDHHIATIYEIIESLQD